MTVKNGNIYILSQLDKHGYVAFSKLVILYAKDEELPILTGCFSRRHVKPFQGERLFYSFVALVNVKENWKAHSFSLLSK